MICACQLALLFLIQSKYIAKEISFYHKYESVVNIHWPLQISNVNICQYKEESYLNPWFSFFL